MCSCKCRSKGSATIAVLAGSGVAIWAALMPARHHDTNNNQKPEPTPSEQVAPAPENHSTPTSTDKVSPSVRTNTSFDVVGCSVQPALSAKLNRYDFISLPTREEPIERWKADGYFCPGDFNRDDKVDRADTEEFMNAMATRTGPFAEFLDINHDGNVDGDDIDAFVKAMESSCDPEQTAYNRRISC